MFDTLLMCSTKSGSSGQAEDSAVLKKRPKKRKSVKAAVRNDTLEDRLAAFGEAFMGSIEGAPVRTVPHSPRSRPAEPGQSSSLSATSEPGPRPSKKRKKACRDAQNPEVSASTADVQPPAVPTKPPSPKLAPASAPAERPAPAASNSRAIPRMSAAEKRRFMSGKVSEIRSRGPNSVGKGSRGGQSEEDREFRQTLREVLDFVTPQLGKEEQRQYEDAKIRALGGTVEKRNKMPYRLLQIKQKERTEQRRQQLQEEKYLGVSMSANQYRNGREVDKLLKQKKEMIKEKKRRREDGDRKSVV